MQLRHFFNSIALLGFIGQLGVLLVGATVIRVAFGMPDDPVEAVALWLVFGFGFFAILLGSFQRPSHND